MVRSFSFWWEAGSGVSGLIEAFKPRPAAAGGVVEVETPSMAGVEE